MCGIAGIIVDNSSQAGSIHALTSNLHHRGPDANGTFVNDNQTVCLGHTRLSIIDLRPESNQPFHSADRRYVVVFNGEIYNYKTLRSELENQHGVVFKTTSDTEVVAEAFATWGINSIRRLEGMFALAIYDQQENKTYIVRDRLGKKPIFYYADDTHFFFASELKALLTVPLIRHANGIDATAVSNFLHLGYIPEPNTIFRSIKKFPAGHWGEVSPRSSLKLSSYWNANEYLSLKKKAKDATVTSQLQQLIDKAVQKRMISDVPLGAFLSGGTDSSLVTAIASKYSSSPLKTFSIGFKESKFDESSYARQVAKHLKTDHHEYILSERDALETLDTYIRHFDEPFADTSAIPTLLVSQLARKEVTVALTGDGGDELFLGYGSYDWAERLNHPLKRILLRPVGQALSLFGDSRLKRISNLFRPSVNLRSHIFAQEQYFFSQEELMDMYVLPDQYHPFHYADPVEAKHLTASEKQALFDLNYYLKDDLLVKVDRASMYHALECRCPLLDHHVVEFALNLPVHYKKRNGIRKWILKELLADYLPTELVHRPKWGFSVPLAKWLRHDLNFLIQEHLSKERIEHVGLVKVEKVQALIKRFFKGEDYLYNRLWVLIVLHKWLKEHGS